MKKTLAARKKFHLWRVLIIGIVLSIIIRLFIFEKFKIYSISMLPTMQSGEFDFVGKYNYGYSRHSFPFATPIPEGVRIFPNAPERGDIAVFKSTRAKARWPYVKRIIGLPGDRVAVQAGRLIINGKPIPRSYLGTYEYADHRGHLWIYAMYEEELPNGKKHKILELSDNEMFDNVEEITVPEGYYYFMGDNRDQSEDSRGSLGLIPFGNLIGKLLLRE